MEFHPGKCQVISFTRSPKPHTHKYTLHGHQLDAVSSAKYLGLTLSKDMTWKTHVSQVISKANRSLGFLKINLQIRSPDIKEKAYFRLGRVCFVSLGPVPQKSGTLHWNGSMEGS